MNTHQEVRSASSVIARTQGGEVPSLVRAREVGRADRAALRMAADGDRLSRQAANIMRIPVGSHRVTLRRAQSAGRGMPSVEVLIDRPATGVNVAPRGVLRQPRAVVLRLVDGCLSALAYRGL